jgi:cytochrome c oxidase subunit 3/cytochrome o ubiquinol oxidase subunit 3
VVSGECLVAGEDCKVSFPEANLEHLSTNHVDPIPATQHSRLTTEQVGVLVFLVTEVAFFGTLIMTYVYFLRQTSRGDPTPRQVFDLRWVVAASLCLFSSSATIHLADKALCRDSRQAFLRLWGLTILLGVLFLLGTAHEWADLIGTHGLTISRNLFGSTYFTLVGFHAFHVSVGVIVMSIVLGLALRHQITARNRNSVECVSWYWHFVDAVWVVVFSLVYLIGR